MEFRSRRYLGLVSSFRYGGHGSGGGYAQGRVNWDRSFDAHLSIIDQGKYLPAISVGLRDFIGTGWYSSEYVVGTKSIGNFEFTAGLGFGRLANRNAFSNPLAVLSSRFDKREVNNFGTGGTLGTINWFQGDAAPFYGIQYFFGDKVTISAEYTPDLMIEESSYLNVTSPWNIGFSFKLNDYLNLSAQHLYGNQLSFTAQVRINPDRPPLLGGKELAPVPMRLRGQDFMPVQTNDESTIRKVLTADKFKIHELKITDETATVIVTNTKFRSTAQAVGRLASTIQRFTSDNVKFANISFYSKDLQTASFRVDLGEHLRRTI